MSQWIKYFWIGGCLIFFNAFPALGARFANQFIEFQLPAQWKCNLEGAEWVCQSGEKGKKREAIIVLAAKLKGSQDSLDQYLSYLKKPKLYHSLRGGPVKSEARYAKTLRLNNHPWVDALHLESEIPGYYTRYLATIKKDIAVLVTYSIKKDKYKSYVDVFEPMVKTLKVFRKGGALNLAKKDGNLFHQGSGFSKTGPSGVFSDAELPDEGQNARAPASSDEGGMGALLLVIALGGAGFWFWKKRKRSN